MRSLIQHRSFDEERALYNLTDCDVRNCTFAGAADGESVLKECRNISVQNCMFSLRYPLWHAKQFEVQQCVMDEKTRAAIWYAEYGHLTDSFFQGIKLLRECTHIQLERCMIQSLEFGWKSRDLTISDCDMISEYLLLNSCDVRLNHVYMQGKYSFQYMEDLEIKNSMLDTKDSFWHSKHVTVTNSTVKGEYLAWFSDGLTMINCKIIGTQPFCYCKNLKLINCTMEETDLAFEYSDVEADIKGEILSVKNPRSGTITADHVGAIIRENPVMECKGTVVIRQ